jgi:hypothetical protein
MITDAGKDIETNNGSESRHDVVIDVVNGDMMELVDMRDLKSRGQ